MFSAPTAPRSRRLRTAAGAAPLAATAFYADIVGKPGDRAVDLAFEELGFFAKDLRMLGTYPMERIRGQ